MCKLARILGIVVILCCFANKGLAYNAYISVIKPSIEGTKEGIRFILDNNPISYSIFIGGTDYSTSDFFGGDNNTSATYPKSSRIRGDRVIAEDVLLDEYYGVGISHLVYGNKQVEFYVGASLGLYEECEQLWDLQILGIGCAEQSSANIGGAEETQIKGSIGADFKVRLGEFSSTNDLFMVISFDTQFGIGVGLGLGYFIGI